jgi:two-component system nitrate/nitrite response regulator NarL
MMRAIVLISPNAIARSGLSQIAVSGDFTVACFGATAADIDWASCDHDILTVVDAGHRPRQVDSIIDVLTYQPEARCVVLVDEFDFDGMLECFAKGAQGYIIKDMPSSPLIASLQLASRGERVLPSNLVEIMLRQPGRAIAEKPDEQQIDEAKLSQRELDVLCCLMTGSSNKEIARQLELSEATVKVHVKAILRKLKVGNRTQAAMWGTVRGVFAQNATRVLN